MTISARLRHLLALGVLLAALALSAAPRIGAQTVPGAICVATFTDLNGNSIRDEGEPPLAGVTVNLSTGEQVVATHVMAEGEAQYCFENLAAGTYTITFQNDPAMRSTTANEGTFTLDEGQRLTITDYGAIPATTAQTDLAAETSAVVLETRTDEPALRQPVRLAISAAGAVAVMVFMIGLGAIVLGIRGLGPRRRARPVPRYSQNYPPPPRQITPPRA
jgi:hypothetical protein